MEITSIKSEEQDEIEKILLPIHGNEAVNEGGLDEYISKLAEFSKNELERKKVDIEYKIAEASSSAALGNSVMPFIAVIGWIILDPKDFRVCLPLLTVFPFLTGWRWHGRDSWKRNYRLYALKMALIEKEGIA